MHVLFELSHYCSYSPSVRIRNYREKENIGLQFLRRSLPCFTELYSLFYINKIKVIGQDLYNMLTPVALAHVIMGDGAVRPQGLLLCTESYSVQDTVRLMNVLIIKYRLECTLRYHRPRQPRIYIKEGSMPILRDIVRPYMVKSILYKLREE